MASSVQKFSLINQSQTFKTRLNSNGDKNFKVDLNIQNISVPVQLEKTSSQVSIKTNIEKNIIDTNGVVNNNTEDSYYDEVVYYDGGGVDGYGN